jgi:hypothetical protein
MDFRNRGMQQTPQTPGSASSSSRFRGSSLSQWLDRGPVVLLLSVAIVIAALTVMLFLAKDPATQAVRKDKFQAVFLNNGQVYFGNIRGVNDKSLSLKNIYYLQTNNQGGQEAAAATANNNVSLVKLGCELHGPYDQMVINNQQILFWENLQDSSQVVKAIAQYQKDNPKGQTCSTSSQNSTQQAPSSSTQTTPPVTGGATATPPATVTPPAGAGTGSGTGTTPSTSR